MLSTTQGDSGGPLWQYSMGRAVLIGISSQSFNDKENCAYSNLPIIYTRVSSYIDWILEQLYGMQHKHFEQTGHSHRFVDKLGVLNKTLDIILSQL